MQGKDRVVPLIIEEQCKGGVADTDANRSHAKAGCDLRARHQQHRVIALPFVNNREVSAQADKAINRNRQLAATEGKQVVARAVVHFTIFAKINYLLAGGIDPKLEAAGKSHARHTCQAHIALGVQRVNGGSGAIK